MARLGFSGDDLGKDAGASRSGSAPPTAEGAAAAEAMADRVYSNFPPPVPSMEDWRSKQRLGGIGDGRKGSEGRQPAIGSGARTAEWTSGDGDGLIGLSLHQKSLAEIFQDDLVRSTSAAGHLSRSTSRRTIDRVEPLSSVGSPALHEMTSIDGLRPSRNAHGVLGLQSTGQQTFASVFGSSHSENASSTRVQSGDIFPSLSGVSLSSAGTMEADDITKSMRDLEIDAYRNYMFNVRSAENLVRQTPLSKNLDPGHSSISSYTNSSDVSYHNPSNSSVIIKDLSASTLGNEPVDLHMPTVTSNTSYGRSGYSMRSALPSMFTNPIGTGNVPPLTENAAAESAIVPFGDDSRALGNEFVSGLGLNRSNDLQIVSRLGNHPLEASVLQFTPLEQHYIHYLKEVEKVTRGVSIYNNPSLERGNMGRSFQDLVGIQEAVLGESVQSNEKYGAPSGGSNYGNYGNPTLGLNSPLRHADRSLYSPGLSLHSNPTDNLDDGRTSTLLEELKNSKTRCFELSDIVGHAVEFSSDQYGSRFIQQKLETATTEEKNIFLQEITPHALSLMTDVFGNYVIQKFFQQGNSAQITALTSLLTGHVLALSLQMYGCRVIQKAIEVVNLDQQIEIASELHGHVIRCVRDQNGNHVVQKCIENIPQDAIHFIISSFYNHVVTLSTHPYGCRIIQRILAHCDDPKTQQIMMDEIMQRVCILAQDQYGNYVIQHVLERGKPRERYAIVRKLAGQIVSMSQQKFASNVVEKCLACGGPEERQILVNEMLGSTDENEPLQAMMKDQYANYVVQKVLETCDDEQRERILSRIKVHLNTLKKYTYGKHIVARVEKLVTAGERRSELHSSHAS